MFSTEADGGRQAWDKRPLYFSVYLRLCLSMEAGVYLCLSMEARQKMRTQNVFYIECVLSMSIYGGEAEDAHTGLCETLRAFHVCQPMSRGQLGPGAAARRAPPPYWPRGGCEC